MSGASVDLHAQRSCRTFSRAWHENHLDTGYVDGVVDDAIVSAGAGLAGAVVGGGAAIWAAALTTKRAERAALAKEQRDDQAKRAEELRKAQTQAATAIIDDLQEMCGLWLDGSGSQGDRANRSVRLWDLHESVRVRALILPASNLYQLNRRSGVLRAQLVVPGAVGREDAAE